MEAAVAIVPTRSGAATSPTAVAAALADTASTCIASTCTTSSITAAARAFATTVPLACPTAAASIEDHDACTM